LPIDESESQSHRWLPGLIIILTIIIGLIWIAG
jgi:hypothetical protein